MANITRYQKERGRTKKFDGFFETARTICESSTHPDRDSLLADIHFCLGAIAMDASDFDASRVHKERSFDLVSRICKELGTADEDYTLRTQSAGYHASRIDGTKKVRRTSRRRCGFAKLSATTFPGPVRPT